LAINNSKVNKANKWVKEKDLIIKKGDYKGVKGAIGFKEDLRTKRGIYKELIRDIKLVIKENLKIKRVFNPIIKGN
jgi:hypothetical protein